MTVQPRVTRLSAPPRLSSVLARGACTSAAKRGPYGGARLPEERLVLPDAATDARHLRAYARVCGFPEPGKGTPLPPSWPHLLGFPLAMQLMAGRDFPFPLLGLVHTGIELTQQRALDADDRPEISVHAEHLEPHRRGTRFDVVTEARLGGRLVWHSRSTYLCRHGGSGRQDGGADGNPDSGTDGGTDGGGRRPEPPAPLPVHDHWRLPSALGRRYASASGDRNPIHLHPLTAKLFGFPRHIAHGMWTFARALAATGAAEGGEQLSVRAEFKAPVLLPSTVAFGLDEPTASTGPYRAPVRVHRFELRRAGGEGGQSPGRLHLTGEVTSEHLPSSGPDRSSRSS
ncbi:MaoC like domain-containing protein [Streptomyces sp. WMMB 714]|uniref:MaoC family dehydratase n=1 Tax=Streptomyces sp. WMMB 714 TaxID=1286822 RepID=UPI0005F783F3|nr:MaoC/PaaZ C-terminal domain-containing protein [Streptomyces sp. WMMB 714]SCK56095.1 MaoC like domain-containing protein [Streptomyces sp. WMMB 714]